MDLVAGLPVVDIGSGELPPKNSLHFATMHSFKGLERMVVNAIAYAEARPHEISFPPSAPLTPAEVPRGVRAVEPAEAWEHLTWKSLGFRFDEPHAFAFRFDSSFTASSA